MQSHVVSGKRGEFSCPNVNFPKPKIVVKTACLIKQKLYIESKNSIYVMLQQQFCK